MTPEDEAFDEIARKQGHWGGGFMAKRAMAADKAQEPVTMYGHCPMCGAKGVSRERRLNGNDLCESGHIYPSRDSTTPPKREWIWLSDADIRETIDSICQYNGDYDEWLCKKIETKIKELNT